MFSFVFEFGTWQRPYIRCIDSASVIMVGFCIGAVVISRHSILGTAVSWQNIAYAMATKQQKKILEEGIENNVDSNVLLTRLRYEAEKYSCND